MNESQNKMKASTIIILYGCVDFISCQSDLLKFSNKCEENIQCASQQCTPICDSSPNDKACTEPSWYYLRHEKEMPTCVDSSYLKRRVATLTYAKPRRIGDSCHTDNNCQSRYCVPMCDTESKLWRCIAPKSFFESQNMEVPKCASVEEYPPTKSLGQLCAYHSECYSRNCVSICESPKLDEESRCIEPRMYFTMSKLLIPKCVSRETMGNLVKTVELSANDKEGATVEKIIWDRLKLLSEKTPNAISKPQRSKKERPPDNWVDFYSALRGGKI